MLWCVVVAVMVAAASGMQVRYDGTPLPDDVVLGGGAATGSPVFNIPAPQFVPQGAPVVVSVPQPQPQFLPQRLPLPAPQQPFLPVFGPAIPQVTFPGVSPVLPPPAPVLPPQGPLSCSYPSGSLVHETLDRREYHFSWCSLPGHTFTYQQAESYCRSLPSDGHPVGFNAVSIESQAEDSFISAIISTYHVPYIWTSGYKVAAYLWRWQSLVSSQYTHWSHTGSLNRAQPDNADGDENCLGVLNNVYGDGIVWHDIGCTFDKYIICERPKAYGS